MTYRYRQRAAAENWCHSHTRRPAHRARPSTGAKWGEPGHSQVLSTMYPMPSPAPPRCELDIAPQYPPTDGTNLCRRSAGLTYRSVLPDPGQKDEMQAISPQMRVGRRAPRAPPTCTMPCVCGARRGYRYRPSVLRLAQYSTRGGPCKMGAAWSWLFLVFLAMGNMAARVSRHTEVGVRARSLWGRGALSHTSLRRVGWWCRGWVAIYIPLAVSASG